MGDRKDCCGDPPKYSKCECRSECHSGQFKVHLFNICSGLGIENSDTYKKHSCPLKGSQL